MISASLLLAYGALAGTLGASWLLQAHWPARAPRLALAAWSALAWSVLVSLMTAGMALAINLPHVSADLARLAHLCVENMRAGFASPGGSLVAGTGLLAAATLGGRTAACLVKDSLRERRGRHSTVALVDLVGRRDLLPGVFVIEHSAPYAFCIGGRHQRVVVTSSLLGTLPEPELSAVLAHEKAHLRQRHHTALLVFRTLSTVLGPFFPAMRRALPRFRLYVELCADDRARRRVGDVPLRRALATLACITQPSGALAASATDVEARLSRLEADTEGLGVVRSLAATCLIVVAIAVPLALVAAPVLAVAWSGICTFG